MKRKTLWRFVAVVLFYKGLLGDARAKFEKEGVAAGLQQVDANWSALAKD